MDNGNIYGGVFSNQNYDAVRSGVSQADISRAEALVYVRIKTAANADARDRSGRFVVIGSTSAIAGDNPGAYPVDFADVSAAAGSVAGKLTVEKTGKFLYLDRELAATLGIYEVYIAFDDADDNSAIPMTPGTAVQRTFGRFRVTAVAFENPSVILAACTAANPDASLRLRFYAGDNLQIHARPDLRVKISDVGQSLTIGAAQIDVLATQIASIYQEVGGILNGAPQARASLTGDVRSEQYASIFTSGMTGNPGEGMGLFSSPANPAYYVDPTAGEFLQTSDKIKARFTLAEAGPNAEMGFMLWAAPYRVATDVVDVPVSFNSATYGAFGIRLDPNEAHGGDILFLDFKYHGPNLAVGTELISGEYVVPSGWIVGYAYCSAGDWTGGGDGTRVYQCFSRWMIGANQPFGGLA